MSPLYVNGIKCLCPSLSNAHAEVSALSTTCLPFHGTGDGLKYPTEMNESLNKITVRAPATTANMGPGFDSLGMALEVFNTISIERSDQFSIRITGNGAGELSTGPDNMVYRGVAAVYSAAGAELPPLAVACHNEIPLRRGLGSSAAAIAGGMVAANLILGGPLPLEELLRLADAIEGHPDNVAPALFGGCQIVIRQGERLISVPCPVDEGLSAVLLVPDVEIPTDKARAVMPKQIPMQDAVHNIGRAALLALALSRGDAKYLALATQDVLHQPYRAPLFPPMTGIFGAAMDAGARGVFLSGSGSTILALAESRLDTIAEAMLQEATRQGVSASTRITRPSAAGVSVVPEGEA